MRSVTTPAPRLGELLIERGIVSEEELQDALRVQEETGERLGDVLKRLGLVAPPVLADVLLLQERWRPLGQMLVDRRLLTQEQLAEVLAEQESTGRPLGEIIRRRFLVSAAALGMVLAEQRELEREAERGYGSGLRSAISTRHEERRGRDSTPPTTPGYTVPEVELEDASAPVVPAAALDSAVDDADRIRILAEALEDKEEALSSLRAAYDRHVEEIESLRAQLADREGALLDSENRVKTLRKMLGFDGDEVGT